ncbi:SLC13 family permease [Paenibacillus faecalis]|uniref:SLC13 family permease n=1 Tax=Paenibacillus faecalis TaxID=2079532 RepID=UPI000D0F7DAC|nr:SLC13 family permease [Paenibacillus faecalis]
MNGQVFTTFWKSLWLQHSKVKHILTFSFTNESQIREQAQRQIENKSVKPPAFKKPQLIGLFLGPALFTLIMLFLSPEGMSPEAKSVLASTVWIATWWITEAIPIPATSLLPIILFPLTGALGTAEVTASYGGTTIYLFLGGFLIALAMERWNLHKRIALTIISVIGTSTQRIILGFMVATGFLSMWISNTATALMMVPIGSAIIYQMSQSMDNQKQAMIQEDENFSKAMMLGIAYSASIGGLATIIGTPPNAILVGVIKEIYGVNISFVSWMMFGVPLTVLLLGLTWFYLMKALPFKVKEIAGGKEIIQEQKNSLGKASFEEKAVLAVFLLTASLWVFYPFVPSSWGWIELDDTMIAIFAGVLLFIIPSSNKRGTGLLDWETAKNVPWGILLLFGAGLAIAAGFNKTGLAEWIGNQLTIVQGVQFIFVIVIVTTIVIFLTEITSNTATATMILPIMASLALAINVHPYALMIPAAVAASCAFMLPVATPPNAVVFASGKIRIVDMARVGFGINIIAIFMIVALVYLLLPIIWGIDLRVFPEAFKK